MQKLLDIDFRSKKLPDDWIEEKGNYSFEDDALFSSWATICKFLIPGKGWKKLIVEVKTTPMKGALISCGDNIATIVINLTEKRHHIRSSSYTILKENIKEVPPTKGRYTVRFEFDNGNLKGLINGEEVISGQDPQYQCYFGEMTLEFRDDCFIYGVTVYGENEIEKPFYTYPIKRDKKLFLEATVDFVDDLIKAPFTSEMFEQYFQELNSWGVKRCHWIYYGGTKDGFWNTPVFNIGNHYSETVKNIGCEIFEYAVKMAHKYNMEIYGLIKPFDMGHGRQTFPENSEIARKYGKLKRIGGVVTWIADFPANNRQFIIARKPENCLLLNDKFTKIDLVKENDSPATFTVEDVEIYVSNDNEKYLPYSGQITREEVIEEYPVWEHTSSGGRKTGRTKKCRVMRFKNLNITEKFLALSVKRRDRSFSNTLINLIHVFGEKGEERCLTYGIYPRYSYIKSKDFSMQGLTTKMDFREKGVEFDFFSPGGPVSPGFDSISALYTLDSGDGFIAIARGKNDGPPAILSPSFKEVQQWWLYLIKNVLDAGADGVELRMRNHNHVCAWGEYGFEKPIRDEFLNRYGVDIWKTDDFDKASFRRLRGEYYTQFYREAKNLVHSYGKKLGLHISITMDMEPEIGAVMDIHFDWRRWLQENLADSITMKEIWPKTRFAEEILSFTRQNGIPVIFSPYANNIWKTGNGVKICERRINLAREGNFDGFQYYEVVSVLEATPDGKLIMLQPELRELFKREFSK